MSSLNVGLCLGCNSHVCSVCPNANNSYKKQLVMNVRAKQASADLMNEGSVGFEVVSCT